MKEFSKDSTDMHRNRVHFCNAAGTRRIYRKASWIALTVVVMGMLASRWCGWSLAQRDPAHPAATEVREPKAREGASDFGTGLRVSETLLEVNLKCAAGLPGADSLNILSATSTLEQWVKRVRIETERHLHRFSENPAEFNHSEAYFRILTLVTVLQEDCGVRYNAERIQSPDFSDSRDLFLHGLLTGKHEGTCVSMPVLYVAVGRQLGYPMKLVTAKAHLFARWESPDGSERFNIEATGKGLNCFPDEYYHTWPVALTPEELASRQYLKSLSPDEELAVFLSVRGHCLEAAGRLPEAQLAYAQAHQLAPKAPQYLAFLAASVREELPEWERVRVDLGQTREPSPVKQGF